VQQLLDSLKDVEGNVLVVSHTGFGRRLRAVIEHISTEDSQNFKNAELTDLGEIHYDN
jgi:broad specificity phosphatase PhoE